MCSDHAINCRLFVFIRRIDDFTIDDVCMRGPPCMILQRSCRSNDGWKVNYVRLRIVRVGSKSKDMIRRGVKYSYNRWIRCDEKPVCVESDVWF